MKVEFYTEHTTYQLSYNVVGPKYAIYNLSGAGHMLLGRLLQQQVCYQGPL